MKRVWASRAQWARHRRALGIDRPSVELSKKLADYATPEEISAAISALEAEREVMSGDLRAQVIHGRIDLALEAIIAGRLPFMAPECMDLCRIIPAVKLLFDRHVAAFDAAYDAARRECEDKAWAEELRRRRSVERIDQLVNDFTRHVGSET